MKIDSSSIGVIILAGGHSSRMKYPKPWLYLTGGATFLEKIEHTYQLANINSIIVVLNEKFGKGRWQSKLKRLDEKTEVVLNNEVDKGRVHSIKLGLEKLKDCDYVFIQNVDSPFIDQDTIRQLIINRSEDKVVQPVFNGESGHPILISRMIMDAIVNAKKDIDNFRELLVPFDKLKVEIQDEHVLMNVNTFDMYLGMKNEFV